MDGLQMEKICASLRFFCFDFRKKRMSCVIQIQVKGWKWGQRSMSFEGDWALFFFVDQRSPAASQSLTFSAVSRSLWLLHSVPLTAVPSPVVCPRYCSVHPGPILVLSQSSQTLTHDEASQIPMHGRDSSCYCITLDYCISGPNYRSSRVS